jgi:hypothetical protein
MPVGIRAIFDGLPGLGFGCCCLARLSYWGLGCGGSGGQRLETGVEAALVAGDGVLVQDALLDTLVEGGDGSAELGLSGGHVALGESFTHQAQGAADAGAVGAVDFRLYDGLTGTLERGNMICHGKFLILLVPGVRGVSRCRGMLAECRFSRIPCNSLVYAKAGLGSIFREHGK